MHVKGVSKEENGGKNIQNIPERKNRDMCSETRIAMKVLSRKNKNIHPNSLK